GGGLRQRRSEAKSRLMTLLPKPSCRKRMGRRVSRRRVMAKTKKVRLGFIGAGWWATANYMPLLAARDDVELVAVCRLGADELRKVKDRFGFAFATESAEELVRHPGLDGVVVASPHTLHHQHARLALTPGLHLMV